MTLPTLPNLRENATAIRSVQDALAEDIQTGDVTTASLVPGHAAATAVIIAREPCVVSGGDVARLVFAQLDAGLRIDTIAADGEKVAAGAAILRIAGRAAAILTGERTALNFMQRMTGIATLTRRFVEAVQAYPTVILDTRKTTPGLRLFEKYAVRCGGGENHRMGLYDRAMIKDNHRQLWRGGAPDQLDGAIAAVRAGYPGIEVEIEVENEAELASALRAGPEWILLDNMPPAALRRCVALIAGRSRVEASGGITLASVAAVAACGVDAISIGCLTHSAPAIDLALEVTP
jgi:nicotinate-nucleotide pyrophosphorylase (carboxylating)